MAFLDGLGKKISEVGQGAIAKTKDLADVAKYNSNISDERKKIELAYIAIGKFYYENHINDLDEVCNEYIANIKSSMVKINEYEDEIVKIKKITKCTACGAENPNDATFCFACGNAIIHDDKKEKACPNCGEVVSDEMLFCSKCGSKID